MIISQGIVPPYPRILGQRSNILYPCYAEVKLDGEANIYECGYLLSKASGKRRAKFPVTDILENIVDNLTILYGELYWGDGKSGALYNFLSHAKDDKLNFCIFDVDTPELNGKDYETRKEWLIKNIMPKLDADGPVRVIRPAYIENCTELDELSDKIRAEGYEGIVVKMPHTILTLTNPKGQLIDNQYGWVKVKFKETGDFEVYDISIGQERMEVLVPPNTTTPNQGCFIHVGVKLVNKYKSLVKVGDIVEIEHQGILKNGGLRHPVFRGKIVSNHT